MHYTIDYFRNIARERDGECLSDDYKTVEQSLSSSVHVEIFGLLNRDM